MSEGLHFCILVIAMEVASLLNSGIRLSGSGVNEIVHGIKQLRARVAELEATVKGHDPFEEYPPKQRGFECSVVVLGKFEYEDEFTPITNWDLCVYWFDDEKWHPLNGYVAGDDIVRWYALPSEAQE